MIASARPLAHLSSEKFLEEPDLAVLDARLMECAPARFYELLCAALSADKPRQLVVQLILKHWPEESLKVSCVFAFCVLLINPSKPFLARNLNIKP